MMAQWAAQLAHSVGSRRPPPCLHRPMPVALPKARTSAPEVPLARCIALHCMTSAADFLWYRAFALSHGLGKVAHSMQQAFHGERLRVGFSFVHVPSASAASHLSRPHAPQARRPPQRESRPIFCASMAWSAKAQSQKHAETVCVCAVGC